MKKQGIVKRAVKKVADIPTFMDTDSIRYTWNSIRRSAAHLCTPRRASIEESFEEALVRLNLTEDDVQSRIKEFSRLAMIFMIMAVLSFIYSTYNAAMGSISGFLLGFIVTLIVLCRVFYFHFWLFQLKQRKLGCSVKEWLNSNLAEKDVPTEKINIAKTTAPTDHASDPTQQPPQNN